MASSTIPALPSNPNDNDGPKILGITIAVTGLALLVVLLRLYVRGAMVRAMGWDDYLMTFAMLLNLTGEAIIIPQVHFGAGRHIGDVQPGDVSLAMKLNFVTQPIYILAVLFVKLSIGASLLRIAAVRAWKTTIYSVMGFMTFYTVGSTITLLLQCSDLRVMWDPTVHAKCWNLPTLQALAYTSVAFNILTDLTFALFIPIPMLWRLKLNKRSKISLIAILGLGVFACAAAIVRIPYVVNYGRGGDLLWDFRWITIWAVVELNTGIIAGSLPSLKALFIEILGSTYGRGTNPGQKYLPSKSTKPASRVFRTLGSRSVPEDSESQSRFAIGNEVHMTDMDKSKLGAQTLMKQSSDDSLEKIAQGRMPGQDIMKTTTTTVAPYRSDSLEKSPRPQTAALNWS